MVSIRFLILISLVTAVCHTLMADQENAAGGIAGSTGAAMEVLQTAARADSEATLAVFLTQARAASPRLKAAQTRARSAEGRVDQAGAWEDPQVGVEIMGTPITSINPFRDGMETDYFIQQMIPLSGKKGLMRDAASAGALKAEQTAYAVERTLRADVKKAYAMIFSAQRRIGVTIENRRLLAEILESTRTKYSTGQVSQSDLLKVQVEYARLENDLAGIEQELVNATAMMNMLRGLPAVTHIGRVADVPLTAVQGTLEELTARALEVRPELRGMNYELEMNRAELAASRREALPDLMVRGMYMQMAEGKDRWGAMVSINLPFAPWSGGKYAGKIEEFTLVARATEQSLADMQSMIQAEVRDTWTNTVTGWHQIERFRQVILPHSEQSMRAILAAYTTDRTDFLSLLDSYRMLQRAKLEFAMLVGDYAIALAKLERAVGEDLRQDESHR